MTHFSLSPSCRLYEPEAGPQALLAGGKASGMGPISLLIEALEEEDRGMKHLAEEILEKVHGGL
ncbi:MAG: hypothetical protein PVH99_17120 [Desulfobacteraceae bacterium]